MHFRLPAGTDGGTPAYPALSVEEVHPARAASTSDYVARLQANEHATILLGPRAEIVLGHPAVEIAAEYETIYDFMDGTAATGQTTTHEIIFEHEGRLLVCQLVAHPEIHASYAATLRNLCHRLEQRSPADAQVR